LRKRVPKTITINQQLVDWINGKIEDKEFANLSHAIEKALYELKKQQEKSIGAKKLAMYRAALAD
jgi:Arc/MetJ-type ribon-helix-helix transcriptional regulator